jgi:AraC-like DNA-binding protein
MALAYREWAPPAALAEHVACLWASHDRAVQVLPDGCVDIVLDGGQLVVAGPATVAALSPAAPGQPRCGLRFRIGSAGAALAWPADELRDLRVPLADVWGRDGRRLQDRVLAAASPLAALAAGVAERLDGDPLVRGAVLALARGASAADAAHAVALGERQLRRRFERAVGYGPATFSRVHRFQRFLRLAESGGEASLARLAADAGYADQAHLARECRRLAGVVPGALLAAGATAAGERSDPFKTPRPARSTLRA